MAQYVQATQLNVYKPRDSVPGQKVGTQQMAASDHDHHPKIAIIFSTVPPQSPSPVFAPRVSLHPSLPYLSPMHTHCKTMGIYWPLWVLDAVLRAGPVLLTLNLPVSWSLHPAFDSICVPSSATDWNSPQKKGSYTSGSSCLQAWELGGCFCQETWPFH